MSYVLELSYNNELVLELKLG